MGDFAGVSGYRGKEYENLQVSLPDRMTGRLQALATLDHFAFYSARGFRVGDLACRFLIGGRSPLDAAIVDGRESMQLRLAFGPVEIQSK